MVLSLDSNLNVERTNIYLRIIRMNLKKIQIDDGDGNIVYRYQQYYKGIIVEGAMYVLHTKKGNIELAHGDIIEGLNFNVEKIIREEDALNIALKAVNAEKFAWEDEILEKDLREDTEDSSATYYPKGRLVITKLPFVKELSKDNFRLAFQFDIKTKIPDDYRSVWIDAFSGDVINNISKEEASSGYGWTYYNGWKYFTTRWRGWPFKYYYLRDKTRGDIFTRWHGDNSKITDKDNYWDYQSERQAVGAHWGVQRAWQYYKDVWNVTGLGNNKDIHVWVDRVYPEPNAEYQPTYYNFDEIYIGKAISGECYTMAALDVIGHEYTHGIVQYSSNFYHTGEPGALEESFCDIFGNVIQEWVEGYDFNRIYTQAEDPIIGTGGIRALHDPLNSGTHSYESGPYCYLAPGHPDTYGGQYWYDGPCHWGGKHGNCGVQNYWFYLLAEGDEHNGIIVDGIGLDKAARIAYGNMVSLTTYDEYDDAREGAVYIARSLYGECSPEHISTMNAWAAVGVGDPAPDPCNPPLSVYITGPEMLYFGDYGTWYANASGGTGNYDYDWYIRYEYQWMGPLGHQSSYSDWFFPLYDYIDLRVDVTSGEQQQYAYYFVWCMDCEGGMMKASVYPNPSDDFLIVNIEETDSETGNATLKSKRIESSQGIKKGLSDEFVFILYNNFGQAVYNKRTNEKRIRINTSNIPEGIYILKIVLKDGIIAKQVVIHK